MFSLLEMMLVELSHQLEIYQIQTFHLESQKFFLTELQLNSVRFDIFSYTFILATTQWQFHQNSKITNLEPRNFMKLNKEALNDGSVNARD